MVRLISRQRGGLAALKLTKLFGINDSPVAKDSGKVLKIIIYCYLIIPTLQHCLVILVELHKPINLFTELARTVLLQEKLHKLFNLVLELVITLLLHHKITHITQPIDTELLPTHITKVLIK